MYVFRRFCHPDFPEEFEGDLCERYEIFLEQYGKRKANWLISKEVVQLLRPGLVGNFSQILLINSTNMKTENRRLIGIIIAIPVLLMIPLIAMIFTNEVNWKFFDFLVMGFLLLATGLCCEWILRKVKGKRGRLLLVGAALLLFLLIWMELAVGVFGSPFAGS